MIWIGILKFSTRSRFACMFLFFNLLICILDLFVYVTQLHECTNLCLLRSNVVNYFLVQYVLYLLNWCSNVITVYVKIIYVMSKPQILY